MSLVPQRSMPPSIPTNRPWAEKLNICPQQSRWIIGSGYAIENTWIRLAEKTVESEMNQFTMNDNEMTRKSCSARECSRWQLRLSRIMMLKWPLREITFQNGGKMKSSKERMVMKTNGSDQSLSSVRSIGSQSSTM